MKATLYKELKQKIADNGITAMDIEAITTLYGEPIALAQIEWTLKNESSSVGLFCTISNAVRKMIKLRENNQTEN